MFGIYQQIISIFARRLLLFGFATYGGIWTIIESLSAFFDSAKPSGWPAYAMLCGVSFIVGLYRAWPSSSIELSVPTTDSIVTVRFGDLLKEQGCVAISVNEFFDGDLGRIVATSSLHGQFIAQKLGGQKVAWSNLIDPVLATLPFVSVPRTQGNWNKFEIGTVAPINLNGVVYLLVAIARTDIATLKADISLQDFCTATGKMWESIRVHSNGNTASIPLMGTGLGGIGLQPAQVLDLLILSFLYYSKKSLVAKSLNIVLHPSMTRHIDLRAIAPFQ